MTGLVNADISATEAWDVSTGSRNVVVGIIDTGVDHGHPDLAANMWSAPAPFSVVIGGATLTCPAGSHGFNAITNACDPQEDHYHGTHVAVTVGAVGNNGIGVAGVNWITSLIGAKFLDATGRGLPMTRWKPSSSSSRPRRRSPAPAVRTSACSTTAGAVANFRRR